jgi:large subunit ribosomal protein L23
MATTKLTPMASTKTTPKNMNIPAATHDVLTRPIVSEKAYALGPLGQYVFRVDRDANKISVRKAVEKLFNVNVTRVNMLNVRGKARNFGKTSGRTSAWKKAIVTLKKGQSIGGQA